MRKAASLNDAIRNYSADSGGATPTGPRANIESASGAPAGIVLDAEGWPVSALAAKDVQRLRRAATCPSLVKHVRFSKRRARADQVYFDWWTNLEMAEAWFVDSPGFVNSPAYLARLAGTGA